MKKLLFLLPLISFAGGINIYATINTPKKLNVVTTIPVLKALAQSIGGDLLIVSSLSTAKEDPHFIKPRPTFKKWLNDADLLIYIGRDLEPWLNDVLRSANNNKLTGVGLGLLKASARTKVLEIPSKLTRDMGDIHKEGNPHVWLSPSNAVIMAEDIKNSLANLDPKNKATYENNFQKFKQALAIKLFGADLITKVPLDLLFKMHGGKVLQSYLKYKKLTLDGWLKIALSIDYTFMTYHKVWTYLADDFDLKIFVLQIEEKSGISPTARYQHELIKKAKEANITHVVAAGYYRGYAKLINKITSDIGGKSIFVDVDCLDGEDYLAMMDRIINTFVKFK